MRKIQFLEEDMPYEIMACDERYLICQRSYTVKENREDIVRWRDGLFALLEDYDDDDDVEHVERDYIADNGEIPEELREDTFFYTIVDLKENIRGADNYYCKFDYSKKEECEKALVELNTVINPNDHFHTYKLEISRRNRVRLNIKSQEAELC